ncbi:MAG: hypothetical protein GBAus27B_000399 [Mycoplasmataceae bacterium]|nr:MAG: hypothetical protein GBAus27B_000399 [Mycoplasmataceae bacterium]
MWTQILSWLGSISFLEFLKKIAKWAWGYAWGVIKNLWDNALTITIAGLSSGLLLYYYNMLYQWFAFAPILNITVLGIFALINISWVISNWKNAPSSPSSSSAGTSIRLNN